MTIAISAPYPATKVTTILPDPNFGNFRATQSTIQIKRGTTGEVWTYTNPNDKENISLTFSLSRQKDLEFAEFVRIYHTATWKVIDHNGKSWKVQLVGRPIRRTARGRVGTTASSTGGEAIEVKINLSCEAL